MDKVINIGINEEKVKEIEREQGEESLEYERYRRFIKMYQDVVMGVDNGLLEEIIEEKKEDIGVEVDKEI